MTWLSNVQNVLLRCRKKTSCKTTKTRNRPVETGGGGGWGDCSPPQIFAKVHLLPIDNDSENKRRAKKHKPYQIRRKLLEPFFLFM